jgi:hypothetical protein
MAMARFVMNQNVLAVGLAVLHIRAYLDYSAPPANARSARTG